jgi:hypothetical protein
VRSPDFGRAGRVFWCLVLLLLVSSAARAEPALRVALDYETDPALPGCPDERAFSRLVRDHLGYDPFDPHAPDVVVARTHLDERGLRGSVEWRDASGSARGERELRSENHDCAELVRMLGFAVAVQIQLLGEDGGGDSTRAAAPQPEAGPPPKAPAPEVDSREVGGGRASHGRSPSRFRVAARGRPRRRVRPRPRRGGRGRVFLALRGERAALELGAEASLATRHATADGNAIEQRLLLGSFAGCVVLSPFAGCLVSKLGELQIEGVGVDVPLAPSGLLALLGPRLSLGAELGPRWAGALRLEVLATLAPGQSR